MSANCGRAGKQAYADSIGGAIQSAGSSVAEVGQQLGDWLRKTRGDDDANDSHQG